MTKETIELEPQAKYQRTITLNQDIADRMSAVCEHLGVTGSAYIKQVIGEAVARHEVSLFARQSKDSTAEVFAQLLSMMGEQNQD